MSERQHDLDTKLAAAYSTALDASHDSALVAIHVGQEVWDYLKSLAIEEPPGGWMATSLFCGFPLLFEEEARPEHVSVRTTTIIS